MSKRINVNFISDVSCPWCAIGWYSLQAALNRVAGEVELDVRFEPFELNPHMPSEGQNLLEHIREKYGSTPEQAAQSREMVRQRAAQVGFNINLTDNSRIYNTFDAHRLLHWAHLCGRQRELKQRLLSGYLGEGRNPSDAETLVELAAAAGLDAGEARSVLDSGAYSDEVRSVEQHWSARGVTSVPTIVFNDSEAVVGGQPPEVFEKVLRELAQ